MIDTDKPIWGENVVGIALGLFDSVQVCHNHYHREATLDGGRVGWGMAEPGEDKQADWGEDELFHRTNWTYYRFLNCGFKLAATGGSAMGVMPVPLGYSRTYAKLDRVAARAIFTSPDGRLRQAHTSPVYITVDDKPTASKADAEVMIHWIDRLLEVSGKPGRYKSNAERTQVQVVFRQARQKYESISQIARQTWGD